MNIITPQKWRHDLIYQAEAYTRVGNSAPDVHLSSTVHGDSTVQQMTVWNEVSLLMSHYAYQVLSRLPEGRTLQRGSLHRRCEQVLRVPAR